LISMIVLPSLRLRLTCFPFSQVWIVVKECIVEN
jgi:hypothetical protein